MNHTDLRPYQKDGHDFLVPAKTGVIGDDPGLGKTCQTIVAAESLGKYPWVVVCPSTVKNQWNREIAEWTDKYTITQIIRTGKDLVQPAHVYIVSYGLAAKLSAQLEEIGTLIIDEIHYCRSLYSKRTREVLGGEFLGGKAERIWGLTGTLIFNKPIDLYPILLCLYPQALVKAPTYIEFAKRYNSGYWIRGAYRSEENMRMGEAKNTEELKFLMEGFMLRRLKRDVLDDLPPVHVNMVEVELTPALKKLNKKYAEHKGKKRNEINERLKDPRGERVIIRKEYALAKIKFAVDYIENDLQSYEKIAVFTYHRDVAEQLRLALRKYKPVVYQGAMNDREKDEAVQVFQGKECRVFIGQVRASGTGLDGLQKVCSRGVLVEWDETPGAVTQLLGRLDRFGQISPVYFSFLVAPDSLESDMITSLIKKRKDVKKIIG